MSDYICAKACNLGGVAYNKGDTIPSEAVLSSRERALVTQGYITLVTPDTSETSSHGESILIPIKTKDSVLEVKMEPKDIINAVSIMQLNAEEAAKAIEKVDTEEVLILIDAVDIRKTVKTAIVERVNQVKAEDEEKDEGEKEDKNKR